ncbi:MAG: hypothetical protein ACFFD1_14925 [Candidatus Thorarchaeota archaeon]
MSSEDNFKEILSEQDNNIPTIPVSKRKYGGKFIAILDNKIIASGSTHIQTRHNVRKSVRSNERRKVQYFYIERKSNLLRSLFLSIVAFLIVNIQLTEKMITLPIDKINILQFLDRLSILIFFDITILAAFFALTTLINPVFRSQTSLGIIDESIRKQDHQVGWEIALATTTCFILLVSVVGQIWLSIEFNISFERNFLTAVILIIFIIHILFILNEDRKLKQLHNYLIDTITFDDRLTYEEIADYLKDIPQLKKVNPDRTAILETIEASLESPFSIRKVIVFRILIRDLEIMLASILIPFTVSYYFFISDRILARFLGCFFASLFLLVYGGIKQNSSAKWAPKFLSEHPYLTLRSGGLDRIYLKFFPEKVSKLKEETVLTILTQSVAFSRGLGLAFLSYSFALIVISFFGLSSELSNFLSSFLIILWVIITASYTGQVARKGTKAWVESVEKSIQEMDLLLKNSLGFTPVDIALYMNVARHARESLLEQN